MESGIPVDLNYFAGGFGVADESCYGIGYSTIGEDTGKIPLEQGSGEILLAFAFLYYLRHIEQLISFLFFCDGDYIDVFGFCAE